MGKTTKELTSFQRAVAIITVVGLMVYACINVYLVVNAYTKLDSNVTEFGDIVANWNSGAILNVTVAKNCPANFEPAIQGRTWPGVSNGCYCPTNISKATLSAKNITCDPFCSSTCSANAKSVGCKDVPGREPQQLNALGKVGSDDVQICIKRTSETYATTGFESVQNCSADTRTCGTGENRFCTKEKYCPISSITIKNPATPAEITACQLDPENCQVLSNSGTDLRTLRIYRGEDALPLAEFNLNEYGMCKVKSKLNVSPGRSLFTLLKDKPSSCNEEGNSKWTVSSTITEDLLFRSNGLSTYIGNLSDYDGPGMDGYYSTSRSGADYTWKLFTRPYIKFKSTCRNRLEPLVGKKEFVDNLRTAQLALMIIGIIASFFLGVPLAFMEFQNLRGVDLSCIDGKGEEERTKLKRIKKFINYFFKGLQLPFQIWGIVLAGTAKALFTDLADEECSDSSTNGILQYLATTLTATYNSTLSALGILAATLLLDLILDIWERRKSKKDKQQEIGNASLAQTSRDETMKVSDLNESNMSKVEFGRPPQITPAPQPQAQAQPQNIVIQLSGLPTQQYPQPQYPPQQYPPAQYPPQQYPPQQYPPQQYPPQQYPPQQYPPAQYPPQQYPPGPGY